MIFEIVLTVYACLIFSLSLIGRSDVPDFLIDIATIFIGLFVPILTLFGCIGLE